MTYKILNRDEHFTHPGPKRILSLDGGGLRGILSLAMLLKVESILRQRHGNNNQFRLCHYFDLIAGTSTGAIIAAGLAQGMSATMSNSAMSFCVNNWISIFLRHN